MKRIIILAIFVTGTTQTFAEPAPRGAKHDPTFSARNYKHPLQAASARELNMDHVAVMETITVRDNSDYKHQLAPRTKTTKKASIATHKGSNAAASHKHPLG